MAIKKLWIWILIFACLGMMLSTMEIKEAKATTITVTVTRTFSSQTYDGYLWAAWQQGSTYGAVRNSTTAQNNWNESSFLGIGQRCLGGSYYLRRSFVYFDTSIIPNDGTITSVVLSLYVEENASKKVFNITIQNGQPNYPRIPLVKGDYYYVYYGGNGGSRSISTISALNYWNITLNTDGISWINKQGITKLCLRSSDDINNIPPTDFEFECFYACEQGEEYAPKLYVTYETEGYRYILHGPYYENGAVAPTIANVTLYSKTENPIHFILNGTSGVANTVTFDVEQAGWYFQWNAIPSSNITSQYGLNCLVYNQSTYYDVLFGQYEQDVNYDALVTLTWNSTYSITNKTAMGFRVNFGAPPNEDRYLNWYVYRQSTATKTRSYYLSAVSFDEFWVYVCNPTKTYATYTIAFLDLAGILKSMPYVSVNRYINGMKIVEKQKTDAEKKVTFYLEAYTAYTLVLGDTVTTYTFGDVIFADSTSISLTIKAVEFPKATLFTYKYIRVYGERALGSPYGNITITYQDTLNMTNNVQVFINYKNGTNVYNTTYTTDSFICTWSSALNDTDYAVVLTINHQQYGVYAWKQYFPRSFSTMPWGMDWFGKLPFNTAFLLPALLIIFAGACFSVVNAYMGAFTMVIMAVILSYLGWLPIPVNILVTAFTFAIIMAIIYAKRRIQT